jgi:ribosomal-protein-alanine N-acetyltransferase
MSKKLAVNIRWAIRQDLPAVMRTENDTFSEPWDEDDFLNILKKRNCIMMVADGGSEATCAMGYVVYELHNHYLTVLNFAVAPVFRRMSIGSQLLAKIQYKTLSHRRDRAMLDVPEQMVEMQLFLRARGLKAIAVLPGETPSADKDYRFIYRPTPEQVREFDLSAPTASA